MIKASSRTPAVGQINWSMQICVKTCVGNGGGFFFLMLFKSFFFQVPMCNFQIPNFLLKI